MLSFMILFARGRGRHLGGITASTSGALTMNMAEQGKGTSTIKGSEMERRKERNSKDAEEVEAENITSPALHTYPADYPKESNVFPNRIISRRAMSIGFG